MAAENKGNPRIEDSKKAAAKEAGMKAAEAKTNEAEKTKTKAITIENAGAKAVEAVYSIKEFADNAKQLFGVRRECVAAALKSAGISSCTVSKAKEVVNIFMKKEVR